MNGIMLGQYVPGNTVLHRLDPRTKMGLVFAYMVVLFVARNFLGLAVLAVLGLAGVVLSRAPLRSLVNGLRPMLFILLLSFGLQAFFTPGQVVWHWGVVHVTREGMQMAFLVATRLVLLIMATSILTITTSPVALTDGIEYLLSPFVPLGVPAHELAMMMTIALRFIPTLYEELDRIMKAQMARGADFTGGNILRRVRNMVPLLVPLFISSLRRADDLALAMEARAYRGGQGRTRLRELSMARRDWAFLTVGLAVMAVAVVLRWWP